MMYNKWFFNRAGHGPPAFYYAFAFIEGPITRWFFEAHLDLLYCLLAYLKAKGAGVTAWAVGRRE
ncbi:MAG TPA: hypothetical protein VGE66_20760 [Chitinophagaceae bacterium]